MTTRVVMRPAVVNNKTDTSDITYYAAYYYSAGSALYNPWGMWDQRQDLVTDATKPGWGGLSGPSDVP